MIVLTLESRHPVIPEPVLRQHTPDSMPQHLSTAPLVKHLIHRHSFKTPRPCGMRVVLFLKALPPRRLQVMAAGHDDVVSAVG